ncbi:Gfo/Idh/MocA family oxidoreductase [Citromicrobium bathyomarinum]|uniref:Gfo/Idh/MocA family protein n=1 Tax=Citromicrobium bathyomarinum TaxID=72174 RepID=UPI00315A1855
MHRVLIIGCGAIAGGYDADRPAGAAPLTHAGAFSADDRFAIAACVDPDETARQAFAARWGIENHAASLEALGVNAGVFDVVSICSPTAFHAEHCDAALALEPRLIFCEKPVADALPEAERLVAACDAAGVALAVNYTRRWAPDLVTLAEQVRAGDWGRVLSATGWYTKGVVHNGGHMVDLLAMFVGPMNLVAVGSPVFDHWDHDPTVSALLTAKDGASVQLVAGDARAFTQFELVLACEKGEIAMRDGGFGIETRRVEGSGTFAGYRNLGERTASAGRYEGAMSLAIANIADHLDNANLGANPLASTGRNALAAQRLCEAIRLASLAKQKDET